MTETDLPGTGRVQNRLESAVGALLGLTIGFGPLALLHFEVVPEPVGVRIAFVVYAGMLTILAMGLVAMKPWHTEGP